MNHAKPLGGSSRAVKRFVMVGQSGQRGWFQAGRAWGQEVRHHQPSAGHGGLRERPRRAAPRWLHGEHSFFSPYPSRSRFYGEGLAIDAGPELLGWILHRKHVRLWQAPFAVVTAWHGEGIISNLRCSGAHP